MAEYDPPIYDVPVFNPAFFINENEITKSYLRANFLEFPIGQGLETLPDLRVENDKIHLGTNSISTGTNSIAIGTNATTSTLTNAVAIGDGATATADNEIKLGSVASFNGDATNGMIFGDVGIALSGETGLQHISLAKNGTNYALAQTTAGLTRINGTGSVGIRINNNGLVYFTNTLHIQTAGIAYDGTSIPSTANNMIGFRWKVSSSQIMGAVDNVLNGVVASVSDRRMKTNIEDYTDALTNIMKLKPKQYDLLKVDIGNCDFTGDNCIIRDMCGNTIEYDSEGNCCDDTENSGEKMTGLILDEVRPIFPEVCIGGDDNSIGTINYAGLVPMLVKAIQEQQEQINQLKERISYLNV